MDNELDIKEFLDLPDSSISIQGRHLWYDIKHNQYNVLLSMAPLKMGYTGGSLNDAIANLLNGIKKEEF